MVPAFIHIHDALILDSMYDVMMNFIVSIIDVIYYLSYVNYHSDAMKLD